MRPVNLIPPEERRGERTAARTGPTAYILVAVLALALGAVTMVVTTDNKIADHKSEIATLEAQEAAAKQEADRLSAYAEFASLAQTRQDTVTTLARSRFDWQRVLNELTIVIPDDVWLTNVTGTVTPDVQIDGGAQIELRSSVTGPALELVGCGASQVAVARFAASLEDIDGITRVAVNKSDRPEQATAAPSGTGGGADCRTRDFIAQFEIVASFDAVQVDPTTSLPVPPATAAPVPGGDDGGVAGAQAQEQQARDSTQQQTERAREAVGLIPGTVR